MCFGSGRLPGGDMGSGADGLRPEVPESGEEDSSPQATSAATNDPRITKRDAERQDMATPPEGDEPGWLEPPHFKPRAGRESPDSPCFVRPWMPRV